MQKANTLIHARWVIPNSPGTTFLENTSIIIENDKIIDILPTSECKKQYESENTINLDQHVIMPGLINAHTHTPMNLFRGLADDLPLMDWLNHHIWPAEKAIITADTVSLGSRLAIAEMIRGGTTCFNDHYFFPEATEKEVLHAGIRACLGLQIFNVPTLWSQNEDEAIDKALDILHRRYQQHDRVTWSIAPHAPYSVSNATLSKIRELSLQYHLPVHIHLHETEDEINMSLKEHSMRPIERLKKLDLVNDKLVAVHMVHLNELDYTQLKNTGTHIVHSPESNLKLGGGIAPMSTLSERGFNIALGTDGAASNNDLDMFGEMRTASFIAKGSTHDSTALNAHTILKMATINGAKTLGIDHLTGSIEKQKQADIIAIDLSDYWQQPVFNPIAHLVYSGNRLSVSDVWVAGKQLLHQKQLCTISESDLLEQTKEISYKIKNFMHHPKS